MGHAAFVQEIINLFLSRVWRYQGDNQNPHIEKGQTTQWSKQKGQTTQWLKQKGQTTQWSKQKGQMDKQWSTKHYTGN
jgi:hypothetical protein